MKILRVLFSPLVFTFLLASMLLFLGIISFWLGILSIIYKAMGATNVQESYKELLSFTFAFIIFPYLSTKEWIITGNLNI